MANLTNCLLVSGLGIQCRDNQGGVSEIYLANDTVNPFVATIAPIGATANPGMVTSIGTQSNFYRFEAPQETLSYTTTGQFSIETQTSFYENTVEMTLFGMSTEINTKLKTLGRGAFKVMIKTSNGKYFLLNIDGPMQVSAVAGGANKAWTDLNGYTVTLSGKSVDPPLEVLPSAALSVITN